MKPLLLFTALFWVGWNAPSLPIPHASPLLVVGAALGFLAGFLAGRRVGHRDTGKGLFGLYVARRWMGRVGP